MFHFMKEFSKICPLNFTSWILTPEILQIISTTTTTKGAQRYLLYANLEFLEYERKQFHCKYSNNLLPSSLNFDLCFNRSISKIHNDSFERIELIKIINL